MARLEDETSSTPAPLGLWDVVSIMIGIVVGVSIYEIPPILLQNVSGPWMALAIWALCGGLSLIGALCLAELASTYPRSGGDYVYLSRAFGPWLGFQYGWFQLTAIRTANIAIMGFVFADYAVSVQNIPDKWRWLPAAAAVVVQGAGDQLLAGAALALDEDGRGCVRDLGDDLGQLLHPGAVTDDFGVAPALPPRLLVRDHVARVVVALAGRLGDDRLELGVLERLGEEVEGAGLHRLHGAVHPAVRRHDDDGYVRVAGHHLAQEAEAVHFRHDEIGHDYIGAIALEGGEGLLAIGGHLHLVTFPLERGRKDLPQVLFVIDDEDAIRHVCAALCHAAGSTGNPASHRVRIAGRSGGGPVILRTLCASLLLVCACSSSSRTCVTVRDCADTDRCVSGECQDPANAPPGKAGDSCASAA